MKHTIRAELTGDSFVSIGEVIERSNAPVLALCRSLIAAGMDPDQSMEVYRAGTLALKIRSIGEAAQLEINSKGTDFALLRAVRTASPMRSREVAATRHASDAPPGAA